VLPGVMGIEAFAEAARALLPAWHVAEVTDVEFRAPVKFYRDEPRTLTVAALIRPDGRDMVAECRLETERVLAGAETPQRTVHFTGTVRLTREPVADAAAADGPVPTVGDRPVLPSDDVYRLYFHGPAYRVVGAAWRPDGPGVAARLAEDLPAAVDGATGTVIGPRLVELCFQAAGLLEAAEDGVLALPARVGRVRPGGGEAGESGGPVALARRHGDRFDCVVVDETGRVVLTLEDYRTVPLPDPVPEDIRATLRSALSL
jgi:hypothetical protein